MNETLVTGGLVFIVGLVLVLPFLSKRVEKQLEAFLFVMGCLAVTISWLWSWHLVKEALIEPIKITLAVLIAGVIFRFIRPKVGKWAHGLRTSVRIFGAVLRYRCRAWLIVQRHHRNYRRINSR